MISKIINKLHSELPATVKLVAVSKFHPFEAIEQAYAAGQRIFAESRPQELKAKVRELEARRSDMSDIQWHFIGHLQTNKLKLVLPYVSLVQSVDSIHLLNAIQNWAAANCRDVNVLLEPHVAQEETKQGLSEDDIYSVLQSAQQGRYPNVRFCGIMGMATFTDDQSLISSDFAHLRQIFDHCRERFPFIADSFTELSIGMSDDYHLAVGYGSTMVRIGSMIFGDRI